jgi:hypothetical protein
MSFALAISSAVLWAISPDIAAGTRWIANPLARRVFARHQQKRPAAALVI